MFNLQKLFVYAVSVKRRVRKPYHQQFKEIAGLASGKQRLGASEYYELGVFDDAVYPPERKSDCVGWRASHLIDQCLNHPHWRAAANDKVLNYAILKHYGFPIPETMACYCTDGNFIGGEQRVQSVEALTGYLRHALTFPVFIKPIHGSYGRGTYQLDSYDAASGCFVDSHQNMIKFDDLVSACVTQGFHGMLFQKCLKPHDDVRKLVGSSTSCARVIVALTHSGPKILMAFWKIARAHNITDNFCMGETGNLLAWLNKDSGTVERIVTGLWPDGEEVTLHPDTGKTLLSAKLPQWQEATAMCLSAAGHFPGLKLQHWDVAFCVAGPVLMELNTEADLGVPQYLGRTPFIDQTIKTMMEAAEGG
ncbi:MAG: hypothetical protein GZ093_05780 [Rhodoferax sp.]|uniref:sugar-transfer associated ATP-grasp domain-containing protein n=1 Tax=Rhodoferax sp. TaxID=50421 RepID=UPI0013FE8CBA|nr:sugar-transfer associated ATP-grasp domain-containing protein [Rhodoferax sp.]NDP38247.1 hypothetical protein [Rhodoferax sp.]